MTQNGHCDLESPPAGTSAASRPAPPAITSQGPAAPSRSAAGNTTCQRDTSTKRTVLIVHRVPVMRLRLATLLRASDDYSLCGEAGHAPQARELFARRSPDLVILGLSVGRGDGIELLKGFRKAKRRVGCLVVTARDDLLSLQRAFRAGALGYILACDDPDEILRALDAISRGEFSASVAASQLLLVAIARGAIASPTAKLALLTIRELEIFRLIGSGFGATRVAAELRVSVKTVESHRTHIKEKLGFASGAELNSCAEDWLLESVRRTRRDAAEKPRE